MLGVSRASAGEMLKRLEADGLVERGERKEAILTEAGRERAERAVRKHRIIERLLTDFMGYTAAEAHVHADELGDTFSDDMVERIRERLGNPERCPHGWPIDTDLRAGPRTTSSSRSRRSSPAQRATIVRLAEHDGDLLHWFYDQGLVPGASVELESAEPAAGQLRVRLDGDEHGDRREGRRRACSSGPARALGRDARRAASPAAARSASALSSRSQVKSWSSRPKWPYAAVFA